MEKIKPIAIWAVIGLAALAFVGAGSMKLMGTPEMHMSFANMGLPTWFGYFIGTCEVAGGIGLLIRKLSAPAAAGLAIIMLGALGYHVTFPPLMAGIGALILLILVVTIFINRRQDAMFLFGSKTAA